MKKIRTHQQIEHQQPTTKHRVSTSHIQAHTHSFISQYCSTAVPPLLSQDNTKNYTNTTKICIYICEHSVSGALYIQIIIVAHHAWCLVYDRYCIIQMNQRSFIILPYLQWMCINIYIYIKIHAPSNIVMQRDSVKFDVYIYIVYSYTHIYYDGLMDWMESSVDTFFMLRSFGMSRLSALIFLVGLVVCTTTALMLLLDLTHINGLWRRWRWDILNSNISRQPTPKPKSTLKEIEIDYHYSFLMRRLPAPLYDINVVNQEETLGLFFCFFFLLSECLPGENWCARWRMNRDIFRHSISLFMNK